MNSVSILFTLSFVCVTTNCLAQQSDTVQTSRQIAPHLFRIYNDSELPRALVVPAGHTPTYSLENLASWRCDENVNPQALPTCGAYFMSQKRIALKQQAVLKEKAKDVYGHTRYAVETTDGQSLDVWTTEFGCNYSPDGATLERYSSIEDRLKDLRSPWGPEPYNNINYNNMLHPGDMRYLQRVAADGRVLWAYAYLVRTTGYTFDKGGYPIVENPLLGFGEVVCPKGSGATGYLTTLNLNGWAKFKFGAMAIEINTLTGQLKAKHPRIRQVPATEMEQQYRRALAELIEEGVIAENDTQLEIERFRNVSPPSRFLNKNNEFSERLQRNLLNTYFNKKTQGANK